MMTIDAFRHSLSEPAPAENADLALQALWWAGKGDWDRAHGYAQQQEGDPDCDWVHAYLHRVEGDLTNAAYWYRRAKQPVATRPLQNEWETIATHLLAKTL